MNGLELGAVLKGNSGEFFVLAELSRRGWTAAETPRNARAYDILARNGDRQVGIRVKTKTAASRVFRWNAKADGTIFLDSGVNDYCVLVDIPADYGHPLFYVVPTPIILKWLVSDFTKWVNTPGARNQQRNPGNKVRLFYVDDDSSRLGHGYREKLERFSGAWSLLLKKA